jgi:diacylglycerol kinase (ATP)
MKALFIVNPSSQGGRTRKFGESLARWLQSHWPESELRWTSHAGHGIELARQGVKAGYQALISVGGDGTLNEVVNGLGFLSKPDRPAIGILAKGTGGDFARGFHEMYPVPKDPGWLRTAGTVDVDMGKITLQDETGSATFRYFVNIADVGLSGEVTRRVNATSKWLGPLHYLRATVAAALRYRAPRIKILRLLGGSCNIPEEMNLLVLILANGRYFGGGMCIAPQARVDDGHFQIIAAPKISYSSLLWQLRRVYQKKRFNHPEVRYGRASLVELAGLTGPLPIDVDGEYFEAQQVKFEILPKALTMLVPQRGNLDTLRRIG